MSVRPSVRRSVRRSVRNAFVKIAENGVMQDGDASYVVYTALFISPRLMLKNRREKKSADGPTDHPTDRPTDTPSYRDAGTHLKTEINKAVYTT